MWQIDFKVFNINYNNSTNSSNILTLFRNSHFCKVAIKVVVILNKIEHSVDWNTVIFDEKYLFLISCNFWLAISGCLVYLNC